MPALSGTQSLENLSPGSNLNLDIYIEDVSLNHSTSEVGITIVGIVGDKYSLKVSEAVTNTIFYQGDINYSSKDTFNHRINLEKNKTYTFTLFDLHNTPLDTYTIKSPLDFKYVEPVAVVPVPTPEPTLPETADYSSLVPGIVLCAVILLIIKKLYYFGRSFR